MEKEIKISAELRYKILSLLYRREDLTCYAIAKRLNVPSSIVYNINKENEIRNTKKTTKHYKSVGKDKTEEVKDYLENTYLSFAAIGRIFNVSSTYVSKINKEYNIRNN